MASSDGKCSMEDYSCSEPPLKDFNFCKKHILQDKAAPFQPCSYIYPISNKRCTQPAQRCDKGLCEGHSSQERMTNLRTVRPKAPPSSMETLFLSLAHYSNKDNLSSCSSDTRSAEEDEEFQDSMPDDSESSLKQNCLNPFVDLDASSINAQVSKVLDYASDSDSDVETAHLNPPWFDANSNTSPGTESLESFEDEPLRHAGVYTEEEIIEITRGKMINLQALYMEQLKRLQYVFREKRREFLHDLKKEKEVFMNIHSQPRLTLKEEQIYQKLKALNRYQKHSGIEAILRKKSIERRVKAANGVQMRGAHGSKCIFTEGGVKCALKVLPLSKYCRKHIIEDPNQVLFKVCGLTKADIPCREPIAVLFERSTCIFHMSLPALPHLNVDNSNGTKADCKEDFDSKLSPVKRLKEEKSVAKTQLQRVLEGETYSAISAPAPKHVSSEQSMSQHSCSRSHTKSCSDVDIDSKQTLRSILEAPSLHQELSSRSELSSLLREPKEKDSPPEDHDYGHQSGN
ncbi:unnamed protein product [Bemisia tabaci]|uniref:KAT8 regulatory NSL complex subunit 2 n=1 Tax=Bemisia tabaci TaxID=7038 RepID=A0A9P0EVW6_BEMTA|nr:unnamed protein product [Bemisia tabaci]